MKKNKTKQTTTLSIPTKLNNIAMEIVIKIFSTKIFKIFKILIYPNDQILKK